MKFAPLLLIALFAIDCGSGGAPPQAETPAQAAQKAGEQKTSTDPSVNPDAAAMADFQRRVEKYAELHKDLAKGSAKQKENTDAAQISAQKTALAAKIQAARADARQGDIFTPEIRTAFRKLLAPEMKGEDGRDAKAIIKDDAPAPGTVAFKVLLPLCLVMTFAYIGDSTVSNWSAKYLDDVLGSSEQMATVPYNVYMVTTLIGRGLGDLVRVID